MVKGKKKQENERISHKRGHIKIKKPGNKELENLNQIF